MSVSMEETSEGELGSTQGTITIFHKKEAKIDEKSFIYEGKPLSVTKSSPETKSSLALPDAYQTSYRFGIPGKAAGLYLLSPISVDVDGKRISTPPMTYEIKSVNASESILKIKAYVDAKEPIFPGQRFTLVYQIDYRGDIQLKRSDLPLIDTQVFQNIGELNVEEKNKENYSSQIITQEVQATQPGSFQFKPSLIEGVDNQNNILQATAKALTVVIYPFPEKGKPLSFTGALGQFTIQAKLLGSSRVIQEETIQLQVAIKGSSDLTSVLLPKLICQPGFSGFFHLSDLPPLSSITNDTKTFIVEMRPLGFGDLMIPSIEFSFFDTQAGKFQSVHTEAIPLTVAPPPLNLKMPSLSREGTSEEKKNWKEALANPLKISFVETSNLPSFTFSRGEALTLWLLFLGSLLGLQAFIKFFILPRFKKPLPLESELDFQKAFLKRREPSLFFKLLEKAFLERLKEKGKISSATLSYEELSSEKSLQPIWNFFYKLDQMIYGRGKALSMSDIQDEAHRLWGKL